MRENHDHRNPAIAEQVRRTAERLKDKVGMTNSMERRMTMAEYIDREAVVDAVIGIYYDTPEINLTAEKFEAAINGIPAADVAPVRHGRWIGRPLCGNSNCRCSVCGFVQNVHANLRGEITQNYCPNCGADMREKEGE